MPAVADAGLPDTVAAVTAGTIGFESTTDAAAIVYEPGTKAVWVVVAVTTFE